MDLSLLDDIKDDVDFCVKLAKEESVMILPGKKWKPMLLASVHLSPFLIIVFEFSNHPLDVYYYPLFLGIDFPALDIIAFGSSVSTPRS